MEGNLILGFGTLIGLFLIATLRGKIYFWR